MKTIMGSTDKSTINNAATGHKAGDTTPINRLLKLLRSVVLFALLITGSTALAQVCGITSNTEAQTNTQVWWAGAGSLGDEYTLDFSSGSAVQTNAATGTSTGTEGTATYTNADGDLLLYTDGIKIFNGQTNVQIANNIGGNPSTVQAAAIVPIPGGDPENDFYVFWNDHVTSSPFGHITIDLSAGTATNNTTLQTNVDERLTVIPHGNGTDFWILVHSFSTSPDTFYVYKADSSNISLVSTQQPVGIDGTLWVGSIVFSPATNKIAINHYRQSIYLADFDVNTGQISNGQLRVSGNSASGATIAFSPSGNRIYYTDLTSLSNPRIRYHNLSGAVGNSTLMNSFDHRGARLAADGKIYFSNTGSPSLGVVSNPDGTPSFSTLSLGSKRGSRSFPNASYAACDILNPPTCLSYDSDPYDISQATYKGKQLDLGSEKPVEVEFNGDGTKMYVLTVTPAGTMKEYDLSTPWDIETAVYNGNSISGLVGAYNWTFKFVPDGSRFFITDNLNDRVVQYDLSTNWDISSVTLISSVNLSSVLHPYGLTFNDDGTKLYVVTNGNDITEFNLSPAYTLAGATYVQNFLTTPTANGPFSIEFSNDGRVMFITGGNALLYRDKVYRYNLSIPWDISTAVVDTFYSITAQHERSVGLTLSADGKYLYIVGASSGVVPGLNEITRYCIGVCDFTEADPTDLGEPTTGESMTIRIENDTFANAGGTLTHGVDYTITNLPTGFMPTLSVAADGLSADLTLSNNAVDHFVVDSISDLIFTWADSAFTSTPAAALCSGAGPTSSNVGVTFYNGLDFGDADDSYGNGSHAGVTTGDLYIGSTAPDGDPEFNLTAGNATTDDADGTDDEGPIIFEMYDHEGGMICSGTSGSYTTAAQEYCVVVSATNNTGSPAQVIGWLDFGDGVGGYTPNGVFDANERSTTTPAGTNSTAVDDGTFTTGNLPNGGTRDVVLVFTGLGVGIAQSRNDTNFRVRVTTDSSFFSDANPAPTGDLPDGEIEDHPISVGTLPVILNEFDSRLDNNLLTLNWGTASEMFNIGFALWGRGGGVAKWQRLNRDLQLVNGGNGAEPKRYKKQIRLSNEFSSIDELLVSSMDVDGKEHYFGPFKIGKHYGNRDAYKPINWSSIQAQMDQRMVSMGYKKIRGRYVNLKASDSDNTNQQTQIEFTVDQDGLYKIKGSDLPQSWHKLPVQALAIVDSQGNPVARHAMSVQPNKRRGGRGLSQRRFGALGSNGWLVFYAKAVEGETKLYSDNTYYRLVQDNALVRTQLIQRRSRIDEGFSASYRERQRLEQDTRYLSATTTDDPWVKQVVTSTMRRSKQISETFILDKPLLAEPIDLLIGAGRITSMRAVDVDGDGKQDDEYQLTGLVYINEHGTNEHGTNEDTPIRLQTHGAIGRGLWDTQYRLEGGSLTSLTDNVLKVGAEFAVGTGYRINQVALDHIGIEYSRPYQAKQGERYLHFIAPDDGGLGYEVSLPRDAQVRAYAMWGNNLALIRPQRRGRIRAGDNIKLRFARLKGSETALTHDEPVSYWVAGKSGYLQVANLIEKSSITKSSLVDKAQGANYLMVVHPSFLGQGNREDNTAGRDAVSEFAAHKRGQGHTVSVVNYLNIVDAYANGQPGPSGLKAYLDALSKDGYLQYVLLIGGGSYDYKDILGKGSVTTIPSYYRPTDYFSSYTNTDADYVRDANGKLFASIGRWPVRSIEEVAVMVDKHLHWSNRNKANNTALLLAENHDARFGIRFSSMLTGLGKRIKTNSEFDSNWDTHNLFVSDLLDKASDAGESLTVGTAVQQTRLAFKAALNDKPQMVMFNGHGSSTALSKPALFTYGDAATINDGASMWLTMACYVTFYESLEVNTLAHQLLFSGPALSISGSTSYSDQNMNEIMAQGLIDGMFKDKLSLGQATTKRHSYIGDNRTMQTNWATLGDPSLMK